MLAAFPRLRMISPHLVRDVGSIRLMKYNRKFLFGLLILGLLSACTQTPEQRAKDATVLIVTGEADSGISNGSGFFVERDKIATNIHVVAGARMVFAVGKTKVYNIEKVTGYDFDRDLVILKVEGKGNPLEISEAKINEPIFVVGYPGGTYDVTKGKVHGIRNSDKQLRLVPEDFPENRVTSVVSTGNSGGPVLNSNGQVIGIAVSTVEDFSFASTSMALKSLLNSDEENLSDWQKKDPILASVYEMWGHNKLESHDYDLAIEGINKAIPLYRSADAYTIRGQAKNTLKRYQEAIKDWDDAIGLIPDNFTVYFLKGIANLKNDNYANAIQDFNKTLELNPDYAEAYRHRGIAKKRKPNPDYAGAVTDYTEAIKRNPKDARAYNNRGNVKLNRNDYDGAFDDYTEAIKRNPKHAYAYLNRGIAQAKKPNPDHAGAIADYTEAINLNSDYTHLGQIYLKLSEMRKNSGQYERANLNFAKAYYCWGRADANSDNYQKAIRKFDRSIALNPDDKTYYARGDAKQKSSDYAGAVADYTEAISLNSDYAKAYYARGDVRLLLSDDGDYQAAVVDFKAAIKRNLNYSEAYYKLGITQHRLGAYQAAINAFDQAIKLKNPTIYAEAYRARAEAKKTLQKNIEAKVDSIIAYNHWGNEAYKSGDYEEAIEHFDKSLALSKNLERAKNFRASAYNRLANIKEKLGRLKADLADLEGAQNLYKEAIQNYDEAIKLATKNDLAYYYTNRGLTKLLRGAIRDHNKTIEDYQAALQDFNKALEQKSNFNFSYHFRGTVRYLLGYAKAKHGHSKEARKLYQSAIEDFKAAIKLVDDALHHKGLGLANAALGKAKAAIDAFEKAKQLEEAKSGN